MNNFIQKIKKFLKDPLFLKYWEKDWRSAPRDDNHLSVRYIGRNKKGLYSYNGGPFMFVQDMYSGIMPYMLYKGEREKYPSRLEPSSPDKEEIIAEGISGRNYLFLTDALCEFIRTTTHTLFSHGIVFYEIVYDKNDNGQIKKFKLESISHHYLFRFWRNYYQIIPWSEAKRHNIRVQIIKIPVKKILKIKFPKELGGKKEIVKILKRLEKLNKELIPKFQMNAMEAKKDIGFNLGDFNKNKYLEVARLTKNFGWNQRKFNDNYVTEYYLVSRFLQLKKIEAIIRREVISGLNKTLNSPLLNLGVNIIVDNIFSTKDVETQEDNLKKGNVSFMDILNVFKL